MSRTYRVLIPTVITANDDDAALTSRLKIAGSVREPGDRSMANGHLEFVSELPDGSGEATRFVWADPVFRRLLPADWRR